MTHIVITGASSGLGASLAEHYAANGNQLTLLGRNADRLDAVAAVCRAAGASVTTYSCDITDRVMVRKALLDAETRAPVDLLIANAGIGGSEVLAPASGEPAELAHRIVSVNIGGVINTVAPLAEIFVARRSGHIVIIGSLAGYHGLPEAPMYSASKSAVRIYGEGLRRLLAPSNVAVTVVSPGFIITPMARSLPMQPIFAWPVERAAKRIVKGIRQRQSEIAFPWQLRTLNFACTLLPKRVVDGVLQAGARLTDRKK